MEAGKYRTNASHSALNHVMGFCKPNCSKAPTNPGTINADRRLKRTEKNVHKKGVTTARRERLLLTMSRNKGRSNAMKEKMIKKMWTAIADDHW
jgi:hypothetical protein